MTSRCRASVAAFLLLCSLPAGGPFGCASPPSADATATSGDELTADEIKASLVALDEAIAELHTHIASIETEIATLEQQNASKIAEIDQLVRNIEARKAEVQAAYERDQQNALIFCLFGYCNVGAASLVMALENDGRVKQLQHELADAQAQQASAHAQLDEFRAKKTLLDAKLGSLRVTEQVLAGLVATDDAPTEAPLQQLAHRADRLVALKNNLQTQAATLGEVKALATDLATVIDSALVKVATASAKADKLAAAAQKQTYELLRILAAGDPDAAAETWLEKLVAKKTKDLLAQIGWNPDAFIDQLVVRALPGQEQTPAAQLLRQRLQAAFQDA
ncbi:MAG: hypothetical protein JWP97_4290 [Labilithrix sp.]|nr:hypothetical protein [Labilithrix sp.]